VAAIILAMEFACLIGFNHNQISGTAASQAKLELLFLFGLGLVAVIGFHYYGIRKFLKEIMSVYKITRQLAEGGSNINGMVKVGSTKIQFDEIKKIAPQLQRIWNDKHNWQRVLLKVVSLR
jgi:hypothetical protein